MKRIFLGALLASFAGSASAFIPPSYQIAIVAEEREELALGTALVEYMVAREAFFRVRDDSFNSGSRACLKAEDPENCFRDSIAKADTGGQIRSVVIMAVPAGDGRQRWQCIGSGERFASSAAVNIVVDIQAALFGAPEDRHTNLRSAANCIQAAANESSQR